jgi:hypothetical protein
VADQIDNHDAGENQQVVFLVSDLPKTLAPRTFSDIF